VALAKSTPKPLLKCHFEATSRNSHVKDLFQNRLYFRSQEKPLRSAFLKWPLSGFTEKPPQSHFQISHFEVAFKKDILKPLFLEIHFKATSKQSHFKVPFKTDFISGSRKSHFKVAS
jgi:hypothetical protein